MKLKKRIFTILALIAVAVGVGSVCNTPNTAQAKGVPTVFPKNMRGTWYQYYTDGVEKDLSKVKITKTTYILGEYTPKVIHKYIPHDKPDFERADWIFIPGYQKQRGITWLNVKQWNEPAEIGYQILVMMAKTVAGVKTAVSFSTVPNLRVTKYYQLQTQLMERAYIIPPTGIAQLNLLKS